VRQYVYEDLPRTDLAAHWTEIVGGGYSVSLFTDWAGPAINQVWVKRRVDGATGVAPQRWFGATLADGPRHPVPGMDAGTCTEQGGIPGPWHTRLPHFRAEFTPSSGDELQSEFFVPRSDALAALAALDRIGERIAPVLHISEIRTVATDELWLSPAYGRDSVTIHFTWHRDATAVAPVLAAVEERLAPFAARPHWGKISGVGADVLRGLYERYDDFGRLIRDQDPTGKFRNDLLDSYFPPAG
jgi:xylitol oxidase